MASQPKSALSRKRSVSVAPPMATDGCVITYFFNGRAFQRLFMESDIDGMKNVVRKKLDLPPTTALSLAQLVDDQRVDLEDDADFSAFKFGTDIKPEMYVEVSISSQPVAQLASPSITSPSLNFDQAPAEPVASSSKQPAAELAKPKRAKKAPAIPAPTDADEPPEQPAATRAKPISKKAPVSTAPAEAPAAPATTAQTKPKKRARKNAVEDEANTTNATAPSVADNSTVIDEPHIDPAPPKKKRKSKAEVAVSLPPPGPSQRKSTAAEKPVSTAAPVVGSNADIMQRWTAESGKAAPAEPKKKKKKAKEPAPPPSDSEPTNCDVCTKIHSGPPLSCPLLTRHDANTVAFIEKRVDGLVASQGPDRAGQFTISALRRWLKERAKEDEARNVFAPTVSAPTPPLKTKKAKAKKKDAGLVIESSQPLIKPPRASTPVEPPRPLIPKKSKPSEVAVSRHEERSSTDDEDIVKSVIQPRIESDIETEEDDAPEEEVPAPVALPKIPTPIASTSRASISSVPVASSTPRAPAPPNPNDVTLARQRMSRPDVLALLDDLENEEANGEQEEDDGGSELAESTPSDVARKRHRKSVRIEQDDSDAGEDEDGDVEMAEVKGDGEEADKKGEEESKKPEFRLSQILKSSQSLGEDGDVSQQSATTDNGKETAKQDDDIEEYESDKAPEEVVVPGSESSPIEPAESPKAQPTKQEEQGDSDEEEAGEETPTPPATRSRKAKRVEVEPKVVEAQEEDPEIENKAIEEPTPPPKKRGRPPLSQAVKDERAAEKARIQAEKGTPGPKKRGRPSLSKPTDDDQPTEESKPKRPRASTNGNTSVMPAEISLPKSRVTSSSQATASQTKSDVAEETVTPPRKRGRPPLSEAVRAEREAEKERLRAEKAIKKMEAKTARADAKRGKGKGSEESEQADEEVEEIEADTTAGAEVDMTALEESHPEWTVMENPPSSSVRGNSSQVDEIEYDPLLMEKNTLTRSMQKPKSIARSMLPKHVPEEDGAEYQSTSKNLARPLFNPSSGLIKTGSHPGPQPDSSPIIPIKTSNGFSLSQPTPTTRRRASALPRFTDIKAKHELLRRERRASQLATPSQVKTQPLQTNDSQEVLVIDESSSDENSSGDERANQTVTPSQKKRKSVLAYFSQG